MANVPFPIDAKDLTTMRAQVYELFRQIYEEFDLPENPISDGIATHVAKTDPHTQYQRESQINVAGGYAGLNASSRVSKGVKTTDDLIVNSTTKGLVVLDTADGNYYRITTTNGVLSITNLGPVAP